jgi:hypothetical protein
MSFFLGLAAGFVVVTAEAVVSEIFGLSIQGTWVTVRQGTGVGHKGAVTFVTLLKLLKLLLVCWLQIDLRNLRGART